MRIPLGVAAVGIAVLFLGPGAVGAEPATPGLTLHVGDFHPTWSPDGRKVAFEVVTPRGGHQIVVQDVRTRRTTTRGWGREPDWGPDGRIAFIAPFTTTPAVTREVPCPRLRFPPCLIGPSPIRQDDVAVVGFRHGRPARIVETEQVDSAPDWSRDGRLAVSVSEPGFPTWRAIRVIAPDGSVSDATGPPSPAAFHIDTSPTWSPGGRLIAFARVYYIGAPEIYVVDVATRSQVRLATVRGVPSALAWSPDGRRIAYSARTGMSDAEWIYVMDADGTALRRLTYGMHPAWSPDGRRILFTRPVPPAGRYTLHVLPARGGRAAPLIGR